MTGLLLTHHHTSLLTHPFPSCASPSRRSQSPPHPPSAPSSQVELTVLPPVPLAPLEGPPGAARPSRGGQLGGPVLQGCRNP